MKQPARIYRYRHFNASTVDSLCTDQLFFANPATFNDPLDCKPHIVADSDISELRDLARLLIQRRIEAEILTSKLNPDRGSEAANFRAFMMASRLVSKELETIRHYSTDPIYEEEQETNERHLLTRKIEDELMSRYEGGVCCFSAVYNNPLMWSHYADQHQGMCIGYDLDDTPTPRLHKVLYGTSRTISTSLIIKALIDHDPQAKITLDQSVLLRKASSWKYEREWRLINKRGLHDSELYLADVTFGLRCPSSLIYTVMKMLERRSNVKFYVIYHVAENFRLKRRKIELRDFNSFPRIAVSAEEIFA